MKKLLIGILIVFIMVEAIFLVMFTETGNGWLIPYINRSLANNVQEAKVEVTYLRLSPASIAVVAKVNDTIDIKLKGPVAWIKQQFDLTYKIDANKLVGSGLSIQKPLHITGRAWGVSAAMDIEGKGKAFDSDISYVLKLVDKRPQNIQANIEEGDLRDILILAGQEPYAKGKLNVKVNMPTLDVAHPEGNAKITVSNGILFAAPLQKDYAVSLPKDTAFSAVFDANAKGHGIGLDGEFSSSLAKFKLTDATYDLKTRTLQTAYRMIVEDLEKLGGIVPIPLDGKLDIGGNVAYSDEKIDATATTESLGGKSLFTFRNDTLNATLEGVQAASLCKLLKQPQYVKGTLDGNAILKNMQHPVGTFSLKSRGEVDGAVVKKFLDIDLNEAFILDGSLDGEIKENNIIAQSRWKTTMGTLNLSDIFYDIKKTTLISAYHLDFPDLAKLEPLTHKRFRGDMVFDGELTQEKQLKITGRGQEFGGTVDFTLLDTKLNAHAKGVTVSKMMYMFVYPQVIEALSEATLSYDLSAGTGNVEATLDNAHILPNKMTRLIKEFVKFDLAQERYNNSKFLAKMTPQKIDFSLDATNKSSYIRIPQGVLYKQSEKLDMAVALSIAGKDLQANVSGTLGSPSVKLDSSAYLKQKLDKKLDKLFDKHKEKLPGGLGRGLLKGIL